MSAPAPAPAPVPSHHGSSEASSSTAPSSTASTSERTDIRCPYCDKPLPVSLLTSHLRPRRPTVSKSHSVPGPGTPRAIPAAHASEAPDSSRAAVSSQELQGSLEHGDDADAKASKATVSEADIKRWSTLAGVRPPSPPPARPEPLEAKPVPLLPPPPGGKGGRFNFFGRKKDEEEDSDDESGGAVGYYKLGAPGSDDEDDGYVSDKPFAPRKRDKVEVDEEEATANGNADVPTQPPDAPKVDDPQLRAVLAEVLERLQGLSQSHADLQTSHTSLLTSLKIARSNLVMAEANAEMMEEELRRAKAAARPQQRTSNDGRGSGDRQRPAVVIPAAQQKGWFGKKMSVNALPSPTATAGERSSSDAPPSPLPSDEVQSLRAQLAAQDKEMESLKKGKKDIEAELEGLSQALFEEANKMVADERKKRAELEENLQEVNDEREALRETIKVLGGRIATPPPKFGADLDHEDEAEDAQVDPDLSPNLDKHYAALRRSIHHVVDGPTPEASIPGTPDMEREGDEGGATPSATNRQKALEMQLPGAFTAPAPIEAEENPW